MMTTHSPDVHPALETLFSMSKREQGLARLSLDLLLQARQACGGFLRFSHKVGSCAIGPSAVTEMSDFDLLVLPITKPGGDPHVEGLEWRLLEEGFEINGSPLHLAKEGRRFSEPYRFTSLSKWTKASPEDGKLVHARLNILIAHSREAFQAFKLAQHVAEQLGLTNKQDRIVVFQAILYGNPFFKKA